MNELLCPLKQAGALADSECGETTARNVSACDREKCAWWNGRCAVLDLACALEHIAQNPGVHA
jgi:hypothetical protein